MNLVADRIKPVPSLWHWNWRCPWMTGATIVAADAVAALLVCCLCGIVLHVAGASLGPGLLLLPLAFPFACYLNGLYPGILLHPADEMQRVFAAATSIFLPIVLMTCIQAGSNHLLLSILMVAWLVITPVVAGVRNLARVLLAGNSWWGVRAMLIGSRQDAARLAETVALKPRSGLRVAALVDAWEEEGGDLPARLQQASSSARGKGISYVIIIRPQSLKVDLSRVSRAMAGCRHVLMIPDPDTFLTHGVRACDVGGSLGIEVPQRLLHTIPKLLKRAFDVVVTGALLLVSLPLFLLVGLAIRLSSAGPIFYGHFRHGKNGDLFRAWKFRTMYVNGDEILERHLLENSEARKEWLAEHKLKSDPRVTGIGRLLRRYSLDELPQLINVFFGEMSLVGPRPIVPNEVEKYGVSFEVCTRVRPGITGLWQVSGRNDLAFSQRIRLNEYYINNWSLWLDFYILAKTGGVVMSGEGAY